jgi:hypothetical protein
MINIKLNGKASIDIPDSWEDLNFKEKLFAFEILSRVISGDLKAEPHVALVKLLIKFTNYKPSKRFNRPDPTSEESPRDNINLNLLRLAERIKFIFIIDEDDRQIIPQYDFKTNPFPAIKIGRKKYSGKRFELDITAKTDITAREFVDCFDLLSAMARLENDDDKQECINQICAILYPANLNYTQNMVSGQNRNMRKLHPLVKFGIVYWFTGIVKFYTEHPTYCILFKGNPSEDGSDKIKLSNEVVLMLQREGYGLPDHMNLNDYFDAQIKHLKDVVNKAMAEGLTIYQLSEKTGIDISTINKLT